MDLMQNPYGRSRRSLNGRWRCMPDPTLSGVLDYRGAEARRGPWQDRDPRRDPGLVEYDFDRAWTLRVPGDWNTQRPDLLRYEGALWYRRRFDAVPAPGRRRFLRFEAANYSARVWLNGAPLGRHEGGFTPFEFEVTGRLKPAGNSLVVLVDSTRSAGSVPTLQTDWWNYGGLTRDVHLLDCPRTFLLDYGFTLGAGGRIRGWVRADGPGRAGALVRVRIPGLKADLRVRCGASGRAGFRLDARPQPWSPEAPRLYRAVLGCAGESVEDRIGFRSLRTQGPDILLNGKPVFLRGVSIHEEAAGPQGGRVTTPAQGRRLLRAARSLGCNFVRLAHYPHNEPMVREAERLGLMVWAEVPVYWNIAWGSRATFANAAAQAEAMVRRDRNRAAVVLWSIGNETPLSAPRLGFMAALARRVRRLDPTRLLSAALEQHGGLRRSVDDPLGRHLDVLGLNEYVGWYDGGPAKCRRVRFATSLNRPLVVSEFGGDAKRGLRGPRSRRWTEEHQAWIYREQLAMLERVPNWRGASPWILKDFRSPRRWLPGVQDGFNRKGLLDENLRPKLAFAVLRDYYRSRAAGGAAGRARRGRRP